MPGLPPLAIRPPLPAPVLVVEDDPLMRQRLTRVLVNIGYTETDIILTACLAEARDRLSQQPMAMALVDLGLPDGNGIELIEEMRTQDPTLLILVISAWSTEEALFGALQAGASGYVLKERGDLEVSLSIHSVLGGGAPIDPFVARRILALLPHATPPAITPEEPESKNLSSREREILEQVSLGLSNREIAEQLSIALNTVECHIKRIYRKLAVSSRTRALNAARQRGLL